MVELRLDHTPNVEPEPRLRLAPMAPERCIRLAPKRRREDGTWEVGLFLRAC